MTPKAKRSKVKVSLFIDEISVFEIPVGRNQWYHISLNMKADPIRYRPKRRRGKR